MWIRTTTLTHNIFATTTTTITTKSTYVQQQPQQQQQQEKQQQSQLYGFMCFVSNVNKHNIYICI